MSEIKMGIRDRKVSTQVKVEMDHMGSGCKFEK